MGEYRYKAFVSYSWADAKWGKWVHHAIETYHTPKALIGQDGAHGPVPARLNPLFKDREEEAAGASIGAAVEAALADSEFLIVVCSPNSARSQWVNREIAWFKTHRKPGKILALIVGGEPGDAEHECFPRALTHEVDADMAVTEVPIDTPLAADARESGDGKRMARLKIAAAMLGVGLDQLVRRDERRRTVRTRAIVAASLALAAMMSTLTWFAVEARKEAELQRNEAEGLIEFMLTDLREKLEPVGRLDALDVVGGRALDYYARQKLSGLDADALGQRARALLLVGEISNLRGDSEEALKAFQQAAATTREQLARDPDNAQRIFDHAQSVFWVGYVAYSRGEQEEAEAQFREYKRLADQLIALDPDNPDWQMESSYAETNLGVMLYSEGRFAEAETAFTNGLQMVSAVAAQEPDNTDRQMEVGLALNWLGIVRGNLGKHRSSLAVHENEIEIYRSVLLRDPANALAENRLSVAEQLLGGQKVNLGDLQGAIDAYNRSIVLNGKLRALEPENTEWQETELRARLSLAEYLRLAGRLPESRAMLDRASGLRVRLIATDPTNDVWSEELKLSEIVARCLLLQAGGDLNGASAQAQDMVALIEAGDGGIADDLAAEAYLRAGDVLLRQGHAERAEEMWQKGLAKVQSVSGSQITRFVLLKRTGDDAEAARVARELDGRGVRHPTYLAER